MSNVKETAKDEEEQRRGGEDPEKRATMDQPWRIYKKFIQFIYYLLLAKLIARLLSR